VTGGGKKEDKNPNLRLPGGVERDVPGEEERTFCHFPKNVRWPGRRRGLWRGGGGKGKRRARWNFLLSRKSFGRVGEDQGERERGRKEADDAVYPILILRPTNYQKEGGRGNLTPTSHRAKRWGGGGGEGPKRRKEKERKTAIFRNYFISPRTTPVERGD